jgi:hypothetical protein
VKARLAMMSDVMPEEYVDGGTCRGNRKPGHFNAKFLHDVLRGSTDKTAHLDWASANGSSDRLQLCCVLGQMAVSMAMDNIGAGIMVLAGAASHVTWLFHQRYEL